MFVLNLALRHIFANKAWRSASLLAPRASHQPNRRGEFVFCLLAACFPLLTSPSLAGDLKEGIYKSVDLGGTIHPGRFSDSWVNETNGAGVIGNMLHTASWDGGELGTEWKIECHSLVNVQVLFDNRDGAGSGVVVVEWYYISGKFWLQSGPWSDEDHEFPIEFAVASVLHQYQSGEVIASNGDVNVFWYHADQVVEWHADFIVLGDTDDAPKRSDYPTFLDPSACPIGLRTSGSWGNWTSLTLEVFRSLPVETKTWGSIKALYGN